ncbi:MAG: HEAT repeat domain-containing protein [Planctomycetota bacterium]|nr:HEAT repeat domain-containing protein [Planctomycetota bacterium]
MSNDQNDLLSEDPTSSHQRKPGLVQVRNHRVMVSRKAVFIFAGTVLALAFLFFSFPKLNQDSQISGFVQSLTSEDTNTRGKAYEQLTRIDDDVTPWFVEALKEANESDRATLIKALGSLGTTKHKIIPVLLKSYKTDPSDSVKRYAALGLCANAQGRSELNSVFIDLTKGKDVLVQRAAIKAITQTGASHPDVLTALTSLFADSNKDIGRRAARAFLDLAPSDHPERAKAERIAK